MLHAVFGCLFTAETQRTMRKEQSAWRKALTPIRKNIRGICGVDHDMTVVTDILIFGLQLY